MTKVPGGRQNAATPRSAADTPATFRAWLGIARSVLLYYGIPGRASRLKSFYGQFVSSDALCFDVGAHVGNRTRAWRALGAQVVMVEPQPLCLKVLHALFGKDTKVWIEPTALGASDGQARLFADSGNPTVTTLSQEWISQVKQDASFEKVSWQPGGMVPVRTLQSLIDQYGLPAFTKIDVEGFEAEILKGLNTALPCLSFEYLPAARQGGLDCLDCLAALGHYEFNRSSGEQHRLASDKWCTEESMRAFLSALRPGDGSGDIYARLVNASGPEHSQ